MTRPVTTVVVFKAQPTGMVIPDLNLLATDAFPDIEEYDAAADQHQRDAEAIVNALSVTLPGGTLDRVVAVLLARHASLLRVRRPG